MPDGDVALCCDGSWIFASVSLLCVQMDSKTDLDMDESDAPQSNAATSSDHDRPPASSAVGPVIDLPFMIDTKLDSRSGTAADRGAAAGLAPDAPSAHVEYHRERGLHVQFTGPDGKPLATKGGDGKDKWHRFFTINVLLPGSVFSTVLSREPEESVEDIPDAIGVEILAHHVDTALEKETHIWSKKLWFSDANTASLRQVDRKKRSLERVGKGDGGGGGGGDDGDGSPSKKAKTRGGGDGDDMKGVSMSTASSEVPAPPASPAPPAATTTATNMWKWRYESALKAIGTIYGYTSNFHIGAKDIDERLVQEGLCPNHYVDQEQEEEYDAKDRVCTCCSRCWEAMDECTCKDRCTTCKGLEECKEGCPVFAKSEEKDYKESWSFDRSPFGYMIVDGTAKADKDKNLCGWVLSRAASESEKPIYLSTFYASLRQRIEQLCEGMVLTREEADTLQSQFYKIADFMKHVREANGQNFVHLTDATRFPNWHSGK